MADSGQKTALGLHRLLRLFMGVLQSLILLYSGCNILHYRIDAPTLWLATATTIELQPALPLGRVMVAQGKCKGFARQQHGKHVTLHQATILALQQLKHLLGLTTDLLARQPKQLVAATADKFDSPDSSSLEHKLQHYTRHGIGQGTQAALRLAQKSGLFAQHTDI